MSAPTLARPAHPVADLFPMLAADELADLAADITARGLLHPIVLDAEGRVLDGRNRLAACEQAGVEPTFVTYDGDDPDGYALSVNIARRHLTKGQQAMIAARACFVSKQDQRSAAKQTGVSASRVAYAATVCQYAPDLVDAVIVGAKGLDAAYAEAKARKEAAQGEEAQLANLREAHPDLADKVVEGELSLKGAQAEARERDESARREIESAREKAARIVGNFRADVSTIAIGAGHGAADLVTPELIAGLRDALAVLEELLP